MLFPHQDFESTQVRLSRSFALPGDEVCLDEEREQYNSLLRATDTCCARTNALLPSPLVLQGRRVGDEGLS